MLSLLSRNEIDEVQWDLCINRSKAGNIFALSWYLDRCERDWCAVVESTDKREYDAVMPLQIKTFAGWPYVYQDPMAKELGVFFVKDGGAEKKILRIVEFAFKHFKYVTTYSFNVSNTLAIACRECTPQMTYHLPLSSEYSTIYQSYSKNRKRNLRKAQKHSQRIISSSNILGLLDLFKRYTAPKIDGFLPYQLLILEKLYQAAMDRKLAELYYVVGPSDEYLAGGVFSCFNSKITYLFGSTSEAGQSSSSHTLLMDYVIKKYAARNYVLDFEGGNNHEGIARFYASFGAQPVFYKTTLVNKLPKVINWLRTARKYVLTKGKHTAV